MSQIPLEMPEKARATFSDALRRTTRTPLYIRPLMWGHHHLKYLHISIKHLDIPKPQITDQKLRCLPAGSADRHSLEVVWYWAQNSTSMIYFHFPNVVVSIIDSIQCKLEKKPFQIDMKCLPTDLDPYLYFEFANRVIKIHPEILISTTTNIPFLAYSSSHHKEELRFSLPFRVRSDFEKTIRDIDPFDVACMLAMAQEQQMRFLNFKQKPDFFTVYLLTPVTSSIALHLFTAHVPKGYLCALYNPNLLVPDDLIITRELIGLSPEDISVTGEGLLVDKLGEILERAFGLHKIMINTERQKEVKEHKAKMRIQSQILHEKQIRNGWWISR